MAATAHNYKYQANKCSCFQQTFCLPFSLETYHTGHHMYLQAINIWLTLMGPSEIATHPELACKM